MADHGMRSPEISSTGLSANDELGLFGDNLRLRGQLVGGEEGHLW